MVQTSVAGLAGLPIPDVCVDGLPDKPTSQADFCGDAAWRQQLPAGVEILSCTYADPSGTITARVTTPVALDYTREVQLRAPLTCTTGRRRPPAWCAHRTGAVSGPVWRHGDCNARACLHRLSPTLPCPRVQAVALAVPARWPPSGATA